MAATFIVSADIYVSASTEAEALEAVRQAVETSDSIYLVGVARDEVLLERS